MTDWTSPRECGHIETIVHQVFWYDRAGRTLCTLCYEDKRCDLEYVRVARTEYGGIQVSTVWLGLDHGFGPEFGTKRLPVIFETMVFGGPMDQEQWRYCTEEQARAGHAEVCSVVFAEVPL